MEISLTKFQGWSLQDEIKSFKESIQSKLDTYTTKHRGKIVELQRKEKKLIIPKKCSPMKFQIIEEERRIVQDRIHECEAQEKEFLTFCEALKSALDNYNRSAHFSRRTCKEYLSEQRKRFGIECNRFLNALPIYARKSDIIDIIANNQVTILIGETGSGKSTQITQYLYDHTDLSKKGALVCTQPRKVAAVTLADHVSREMGVKVGTTVGYRVGMHGKFNTNTKVYYTTDHALLNECIEDRLFSKYSCVIIDEAHERSLQTDILLAFLKQCLPQRKDLRVVITSATIDASLFTKYFGDYPVVSVSGRMYPVEVYWRPGMDPDKSTPLQRDHLKDAVDQALKIHKEEQPGDLLVFLTSQKDIETASDLLLNSGEAIEDCEILPLHGKLQPEDQRKVFHDYEGKRKIVLATNVAETSVTIPGVKYIVDTGLAKVMMFDPHRNMNTLEVQLISKSSAEQRKGRAGRTAPGKCYRLYSEDDFQSMPNKTAPEILRVHLTHAALKLYQFGIGNILDFDFVEHPNSQALRVAVETLVFLGAVRDNKLTDLGQRISALPLDPQLSKVLLDAIGEGVGLEAAIMAAMSSISGNIFFRGGTDEEKEKSDKKKVTFCHSLGDSMTHLNVFCQWVALQREKRNKWCVENFINAKSMRIVEETLKELRDILKTQFSIILSVKPPNLQNAEKTLPLLLFNTFIRNLSVFLGHERAGYISERAPDENLLIFPGGSLRQLSIAPKYLIYEKTLKTSQHFLLQVLPIQEEWVQQALQDGRLQADPAIKYRKYFLQSVTFSNLNETVYKKAILYKLSTIRSCLADVCEGTPCPDDLSQLQRGIFIVFVQKCFVDSVHILIDGMLQGVRDEMKCQTYETGVTKPDDDVRVVLGAGGAIKCVLMPQDYRVVEVKGPTAGSDTWKESALTTLRTFGSIEKHHTKVFKDGLCHMFVHFEDPASASQAVRLFIHPEEELSIKPVLLGRDQGVCSKYTLLVEWDRRKRKPYGFVSFSCEEDYLITLGSLSILYVNGSPVKMRPSKDGQPQLFIPNLPIHISEESVKQAILNNVIGIGDIKVSRGFEKSFSTTKEELDIKRRQLDLLISDYAQSKKYKLDLKMPKPQFVTYMAYVSFDNPEEGSSVLRHLGSESIGVEILRVKPLLSVSLRYIPSIFQVIREKVDRTVHNLRSIYQGQLTLIIKEDSYKNHIVELKSNDEETFVNARNILMDVLKPDVIECSNRVLRQYIQGRTTKSELSAIATETGTFITVDYRSNSINMYGDESNCTRAKIALNGKLERYSEGADVRILQLKGPNKPPGLMKKFVHTFGVDLLNLLQMKGMREASLNPKRQEVTLLCTKEAFTNLGRQIDYWCEELSTNPPHRRDENPDCCVCFTPVEDAMEIYMLVYCGHVYCMECIKLQISPNTATFPLTCATEDCEKELVWQDFLNLEQKANIKKEHIMASSLRSYLERNPNKVRNCPTPNCKMVYVIDLEEGRRFFCSHCGVSTCTKCHVQYHDGQTCAMYQANKDSDKGLEEWLRANPANRKKCPNCSTPIEKAAGCQHLSCRCGAHICWNCLKYFPTSQECYAHLSNSHGNFV